MTKLVDAVRAAIGSSSEGLRVALVATVKRYDETTGRADVRPVVPFVDEGGNAQQWPTLHGVPVLFAGAVGVQFSFALPEGSEGLIVFHDLSLAGWKEGDTDPRGRRSHALADGVFIPGLAAKGRALAGDGLSMSAGASVISLVDGEATINAEAVELGPPGRDGVVRKADLQTAIDSIKSYVDSKIIGHTHSGVTTGPGVSGNGAPLAPSAIAPAKASTKVKAS